MAASAPDKNKQYIKQAGPQRDTRINNSGYVEGSHTPHPQGPTSAFTPHRHPPRDQTSDGRTRPAPRNLDFDQPPNTLRYNFENNYDYYDNRYDYRDNRYYYRDNRHDYRGNRNDYNGNRYDYRDNRNDYRDNRRHFFDYKRDPFYNRSDYEGIVGNYQTREDEYHLHPHFFEFPRQNSYLNQQQNKQYQPNCSQISNHRPEYPSTPNYPTLTSQNNFPSQHQSESCQIDPLQTSNSNNLPPNPSRPAPIYPDRPASPGLIRSEQNRVRFNFDGQPRFPSHNRFQNNPPYNSQNYSTPFRHDSFRSNLSHSYQVMRKWN